VATQLGSRGSPSFWLWFNEFRVGEWCLVEVACGCVWSLRAGGVLIGLDGIWIERPTCGWTLEAGIINRLARYQDSRCL